MLVERALDLSQTCIPTLGICSATLTLGHGSNSLGLRLFSFSVHIGHNTRFVLGVSVPKNQLPLEMLSWGPTHAQECPDFTQTQA